MQHMGRICEWYVFLYDDADDDKDGDDKMRWGNFGWVVVGEENLLEFKFLRHLVRINEVKPNLKKCHSKHQPQLSLIMFVNLLRLSK